MNKTFYFLLTERDDTRIGVVGAATNEELNQKATQAINSHFDINTETVIDLNMEDYMYGKQGEFTVAIDRESEDADNYTDNIFIEIIDVY